MEYIDGEEIGKGWEKRSELEKASLLKQLNGYFEKLRKIPHPQPGAIAAADMQSCYDPRTFQRVYGSVPLPKGSTSIAFFSSAWNLIMISWTLRKLGS
jgi:hypothetical protein